MLVTQNPGFDGVGTAGIGDSYFITFQGALAGQNVPLMSTNQGEQVATLNPAAAQARKPTSIPPGSHRRLRSLTYHDGQRHSSDRRRHRFNASHPPNGSGRPRLHDNHESLASLSNTSYELGFGSGHHKAWDPELQFNGHHYDRSHYSGHTGFDRSKQINRTHRYAARSGQCDRDHPAAHAHRDQYKCRVHHHLHRQRL